MIKRFKKNRSVSGLLREAVRSVLLLGWVAAAVAVCELLLLMTVVPSVHAQSDATGSRPAPTVPAQTPPAPTPPAPTATEPTLPSTAYVFGGISGFIPFKQSYRINFGTSLGGLPIEVNGGLSFPVSQSVLVPLTVRYLHRTATYVDGMTLSSLSIEPGVHVFLDKYQPKELRFFAGGSLVLVRTTVDALIDATSDGTHPTQQAALHQYMNFGIGLDLGLSYDVGATSAIDGGIHLGVLLANPTTHGGLGNIGGISLGAIYRFGF